MEPFAIFRQWWADIGRRRPDKTARDYRGFVFRAFADTGWDPIEVTAGQIRGYLDGFRTNHANMIRCGLADFTAWMVEHGLRASDPLADAPRRRAGKRKLKRSLSEPELVRLLIALRYIGRWRRRWDGERLALLVLAQFYTGTRPGEITSLTTDRVHLGTKPRVEIVETKTGDDRIVPLCTKAVEVFTELCRDRVGRISDVRASQYWYRVKQAATLAGIPEEKARPYALRHSFARILIDAGVPERDVADLMGHSDLRAMWGYTVPDDEVLRGHVELLP